MKNIVHFLVVFLFQSNIVYLFLFSISCEPVLNSPYEFGTSEFYRTQSFVCLVNPSSVCNTNPNRANDTVDFNAIPGRRLWLRAEGLPFANSVPVTNWVDLSGNGNNLTPGVAPTFFSTSSTINGRPVVRFQFGPGSNLTNLSPVGVTASDSGSLFFVARVPLVVNSNLLTIGPVGGGGREFQITSVGVIALNRSGISSVATYNSGWVANSVHQVSILQNGGTNVLLKIDGIQTLSVTPGSTGYTPGSLTLGAGGAELDIAELLYFDNRVSDENAVKIECYLGNRYGTFSCP